MAVVVLDTSVLQHVLQEHGATVYKVAKAAEGHGVSQALIYSIAGGKTKPSLDSLGVLIAAVEEVTGERIAIDRLLKYDPNGKAGLTRHRAIIGRPGLE